MGEKEQTALQCATVASLATWAGLWVTLRSARQFALRPASGAGQALTGIPVSGVTP